MFLLLMYDLLHKSNQINYTEQKGIGKIKIITTFVIRKKN